MEPGNKELLFIQLVMQNHQLALMSLGKLENPVTNKVEKNLEFAKMAIDTIDMLKDKTRGNLSEYEEQYINETLRALKLDYVSEIGKG